LACRSDSFGSRARTDLEDGSNLDDWKSTSVGFQLKEIEGNTHVHFFHLGWLEASEYFGITTYCWGELLQGLKKHVEEGIIIPHARRNQI
jgi:hypothetical protein